MTDFAELILEYTQGCEQLQKRVQELNCMIHASKEPHQAEKLVQRRYQLYIQISEMEWAIREMKEYVAPRRQTITYTQTASA